MIAAASFNQLASTFLDFLFIVTLLFGVPKILQGARLIARGEQGEGMACVVAGFLTCAAVPIIRMIAGWMSVSI